MVSRPEMPDRICMHVGISGDNKLFIRNAPSWIDTASILATATKLAISEVKKEQQTNGDPSPRATGLWLPGES